MTYFTSSEYLVTKKQLELFFHNDQYMDGIHFLSLDHITIYPLGKGHYKIISDWTVNEKDLRITIKTNDSLLYDALKSGEEYFEKDIYYDTWDEVIESLLYRLKPIDKIYEFIFR